MVRAHHRVGVMFRITIIAGQAKRPFAESPPLPIMVGRVGRRHMRHPDFDKASPAKMH